MGSRPVPPPIPPDDQAAWYAPAVRSQVELYPGVIATIEATGTGFRYRVREPPVGADQSRLDTLIDRIESDRQRRPLTRDGVREALCAGLDGATATVVNDIDGTPDRQRRLRYHLLRATVGLESVTPLALDERITVADVAADPVVVHTARFAPIETPYAPSTPHLDRAVAQRHKRHTVSFAGVDVPVVIYRDARIGGDAFAVKYAALEPTVGPAEAALVEACKERIWDGGADSLDNRQAFIETRARAFFERQSRQGGLRGTLQDRMKRMLGSDPTEAHRREDRTDALVYHVLREFVGEGPLTIPIRDPHLEDIEANRTDERIKVVPRAPVEGRGRIPTNLAFTDDQAFIDVATQLAAADGVELTAAQPTARVNITPPGLPEHTTIRCAVALPTVSEEGPYIAIRKQAPEALTPVDLIDAGTLSVELVALLWQLLQHRCVVLFAGPTGTGKTTLLNAHLPFIEFDKRPVAIDEGAREVTLPHETGVALSASNGESAESGAGRSMAHLIEECNYLNPDIEIIGELNSPDSFASFATALSTGHGIVGTTHADDVRTFVHRVVEQGLAPHHLTEIDVVIFSRHFEGQRYVGQAIEFLETNTFGDREGRVEIGEATINWNVILERDRLGNVEFAYTHPRLEDTGTTDRSGGQIGDRLEESAFDETDVTQPTTRSGDGPVCMTRVFHRIADRTDRPVRAVEAEYHRKVRYVRYLVEQGVADFESLFAFLADLQSDEAATVERIRG